MTEKASWRRYTLHAHSAVPYPVPIVLTAEAREQLAQDVQLDGLEEAGGLYGHCSDGELVIEAVVKATLPGRTSTDVSLDFAVVDQLHEHFANGAGWAWCGDWHTHTRYGATEPSRIDCEGWVSRARASRVGVMPGRSAGIYAGLIISPPGWSHRPTITGWLTQLAEDGNHQIRPVRVIEEVQPTPLRAYAS
jgi:hypothetical protein